MAEIARWSGILFEVSASAVLGFTDLKITGKTGTEETTKNKISYVKVKAAKATQVTMTVHADARLGNDPRQVSMDFVEKSKLGTEDYFYIESKKLVPYKLMLTSAQVEKVTISPSGSWICADIKLTFDQCSEVDPAEEAAQETKKSSGTYAASSSWVTETADETTTTKKSSGKSTTKTEDKVVYNALTGKYTYADSTTQNVYVFNASTSKTTDAARTTSLTSANAPTKKMKNIPK